MKPTIPSFLCGAAVGAVAASVAWSGSSAPAPVEDAPAAAVAGAAETEAEALAPVVEAVEAAPGAEEAPAALAPAAAEPVAAPPAAAPAAAPVAENPPQRRGPPRWEDMTDEQREEMRQRFRRMHDENATRVVDAFVERNGLTEDGGERLFGIADAMNERALARVQLWIDYMQLQGIERLPRDRGPQLMRDLFDDLVKGYEEMDEAFGTEWREKDADFDLAQMVDPEVWGSLFRLGGFAGPGMRRGGPGGPRPPQGGRPPAGAPRP